MSEKLTNSQVQISTLGYNHMNLNVQNQLKYMFEGFGNKKSVSFVSLKGKKSSGTGSKLKLCKQHFLLSELWFLLRPLKEIRAHNKEYKK